MTSASPRRLSSASVGICRQALAVVAWVCSLQVFAQPVADPSLAKAPTHCTAAERVQFSCRLDEKTVSLCAAGQGDAGTLSYRYGRIGQVELAHTADGSPDSRFMAASLPLQPGAQVQQVWFDNAGHRYMLAVCVGGMCPQQAVLAVLRAGRVVSRQVCPLGPGQDAWFTRDVIAFGNGTEDTRTDQRLVELVDDDNPLEQVFISRRTEPQ